MDTNSYSNPWLLWILDLCDRGAVVALWRQCRVLCSSLGFEINTADVKTAAYQIGTTDAVYQRSLGHFWSMFFLKIICTNLNRIRKNGKYDTSVRVGSIHKKHRPKISCYCPFKVLVDFLLYLLGSICPDMNLCYSPTYRRLLQSTTKWRNKIYKYNNYHKHPHNSSSVIAFQLLYRSEGSWVELRSSV